LVNYYSILGVNTKSSPSEIKKQFRIRVKRLHPDIKGPESIDSNRDLRLLLKAYEVLSNPEKRIDYDNSLNSYLKRKKNEFNYRDFLKSRKEDLICQSKLIFYDLLNSNPEDAVFLHEKLQKERNFSLNKYMSWADYMDCTFLLAEQYSKTSNFIKAFKLYKQLYVDEMKRPYFKHFIQEIVDRLKKIVGHKMCKKTKPEKIINYIEELINLNISDKENAYFYKAMAECYLKINRNDMALLSVKNALKYNSRIEGINNIKKKIKMPEMQLII
jgi:curved DNA-binding protein CbpA